MEGNRPVREIQEILAEKRPELGEEAMYVFNGPVQVEELETPVMEVFKSGDTVLAWINNDMDAPSTTKDKGWGPKRAIGNESGVEIKLRLKHFGRKVCFSDDMLHAIDFNKWSKRVEVYWYL